MSLEERFHAAVDAIQKLPASGSFQPSNLTKLIFYGLYKQATVGPCNEPKPSTFNIVNRAKWEAWDRNRAMSKEEAMKAYIAEIRNLIQTMSNSDEVIAFKKLIDPPEQSAASSVPSLRDKSASISSVLSSSSSVSSLSASEMDEFFDDPSDQGLVDRYEIISPSTSFHPIANVSSNADTSFTSSEHSTIRPTTDSNGVGSTISSIGDVNRETQKAILSALMKLQDDVHHILERLNRVETSDIILQQRELLLLSSDTNASLSWLPLAGLRRRAIAFILLWPFIALGLIRLFQRAKIIIRFRQRKIL